MECCVQSAEGPFGELIRDSRWQDLRAGFLAEATRLAAEAIECAREAPGATLIDGARRKLRNLAHRIRGSAGFFEFDAVASCAAELEDAVISESDSGTLVDLATRLQVNIEAAREARQ
jgi:HPt (histidine-containing phosphotransfer) domain-containing protein